MKVRVNGETTEIVDGGNVVDLLKALEYSSCSVVVAVNEVFVPRPLYEAKLLSENDRVEILGPMQGG